MVVSEDPSGSCGTGHLSIRRLKLLTESPCLQEKGMQTEKPVCVKVEEHELGATYNLCLRTGLLSRKSKDT